ncbi:hypothetical protein [Bacillus sp. FJAT-42315]|uniref:hypothetical protein n=1 Tax=Bacillus sp. FJAT-42315 TaxID=2014077 RepID=UPI000C2439D8|nr:hypothetical protein [Bacillus sp. FJAT-42315]
MNGSESMLTYRKEDRGSPLVAGVWSWTMKKSGKRWSAAYELEPSARDKGKRNAKPTRSAVTSKRRAD